MSSVADNMIKTVSFVYLLEAKSSFPGWDYKLLCNFGVLDIKNTKSPSL